MVKKLIVLESIEQFKKLQKTENRIKKNDNFKNLKILANEPEIQVLLKDLKVPFYTFFDFYTEAEINLLKKRLSKFENMFYLANKEIEKTFIINGINYGYVIKDELSYLLNSILKTILSISYLIEKNNFDEIIGFKSDSSLSSILTNENDDTASIFIKKISSRINSKIKIIKYHHEIRKTNLDKYKSIYIWLSNKFTLNFFTKKKNKILFFMGRTEQVNRIVKEMPKKYAPLLFEPFPPNIKNFISNPFYFSSFNYKVNLKGLESNKKIEESFLKRFYRLKRRKDFINLFENLVLDFNLFDIKLIEILDEKFMWIFQKKFSEMFIIQQKLEYLFKLYKIKVVYLDNVTTIRNKLIIYTAKRNNIFTIHVHHGIYGFHYFGSFIDDIADYDITWGNFIKKYMKSIGLTNNKIFSFGNPNFDYYTSQLPTVKALDQRPKQIIFAHTWLARSNQRIKIDFTMKDFLTAITSVIQTIKTFPDYELILKLHYSDKIPNKFYEKIMRDLDFKNYKIIKFANNFDLFSKSQLAILFGFSSTFVELLLTSTPIIVANYHLESNEFYDQIPNFKIAKNALDLSSFMKTVLQNPNEISFDRKQIQEIVSLQGDASKKIALLFQKLILNQ